MKTPGPPNSLRRRLIPISRHVRTQRRGRATERGGWPTSEPNPVFSEPESPAETVAAQADQDQTTETGSQMGEATEQDAHG